MLTVYRSARVAWTLLTWFVVESIIFGLSALPGALFWQWHLSWSFPSHWARIVTLAMAFMPAYLLFAVALMALSAAATRGLGWRPTPGAEMRIHELGWALLDWVRGTAVAHVVRVFAGTFLRASPIWTMYLRLNGARIGRAVYVNTLGISDHSLLEIGADSVIGSDVHIAGHTVEGGVVRTARVRIGQNVTIGVGSVVMMGAEIGDGCELGALSFVPKRTRLEAGVTYIGIPVRALRASSP